MATFRYRAVRLDGSALSGQIDARDRSEAVNNLRRSGVTPVEVSLASEPRLDGSRRMSARSRAAAATAVGELAVLLKAGLQLDRALALAVENIEDKDLSLRLAEILREVREGVPLSRAMAQKPDLFSPISVAMAEAGEANGRLGEALERLSTALEQEAELRRLISSSMIYPVVLLIVATGVVLLMLLFVVPQFESMFSGIGRGLPAAAAAVVAASRFLRDYGLLIPFLLVMGGFGLPAAMRQPAVRLVKDRLILATPQLGELVRRIETARFARTLGALIEGEVALPAALILSHRTIANQVLSRAIRRVADGVKEGGGLAAPLAAADVLPRLALGFLRTGEETSQLGLMLTRLADVLDRDIRIRLERLIGIITPVITVALGATVAAIIAAIMSAILSFNDLAVAQ